MALCRAQHSVDRRSSRTVLPAAAPAGLSPGPLVCIPQPRDPQPLRGYPYCLHDGALHLAQCE